MTFAHVRNPLGELNENEVEWRRQRAGDDVLTEWEALRDARERTLAAGDAAYFARPMITPTGPGTMADFLAVRILDCWLHEQDLRRALGRPGNLDGPAAEHTVDRLVRHAADRGRQAGRLPGGRGRDHRHHRRGRAHRPLSRSTTVGRRSSTRRPARPLATVTMPTEAFVVLATGRVAADEQVGST